MVVISFVFIFILGAAIGSFLNVVVDRLKTGESLIFKRSYCASCKKTLSPKELFPIISYILLGGKCGSCKSKIPVRLLLVELASACAFTFLFALLLIQKITFVDFVYLNLVLLALLGIFFSDIEYGIIPDELVIFFAGITLLYLFLFDTFSVINHFLSAIFLFLAFLFLFLITKKRGMGFGDVKLSFAIGLFLGFPLVLVSVYLAFLTGAAVSLILIAWGKKKLKRDTIPFGPFLTLSCIISYFLGLFIIQKILLFLD